MSSGLYGIIAGETQISSVGGDQGLNYRGYNIYELAKYSTFEEVLFLLIFARLPSSIELQNLIQKISNQRIIPNQIKNILEILPISSNYMDILRTIVSILGIIEPENERNNSIDISLRLIALYGPCLLYWYNFQTFGIRIKTFTGETDSIALNFLKLLKNANPNELEVKALDVSFILYAEHDFNASTFCSRVVASTNSDFYSSICAAIGALRGNLHGGANEAAMEFLKDINDIKSAENKVI